MIDFDWKKHKNIVWGLAVKEWVKFCTATEVTARRAHRHNYEHWMEVHDRAIREITRLEKNDE